MDSRIIIITSKNKKESLKVSWEDLLRYLNGYASFKELKEKYNEVSSGKEKNHECNKR